MTRAKSKQMMKQLARKHNNSKSTCPHGLVNNCGICTQAQQLHVDPRRVPTTEEEIMNHPMVKDYARLWDKLESARNHNEYESVNVSLNGFDIRQLQGGLEENRKRLIKALTALAQQVQQ